MTHTPGPWAVFEGDKVVPASYKRTGFTVIAQCYVVTTNVSLDYKLNAQRIVNCVNACEGLTDEELVDLQAFIKARKTK